jgi:aspartate-semialdehyde dehydrogenase
MAATVGRLRPCSLLDWKFVVLSHNTIRGAAGAAVLNAEVLARMGKFDKMSMPAEAKGGIKLQAAVTA